MNQSIAVFCVVSIVVLCLWIFFINKNTTRLEREEKEEKERSEMKQREEREDEERRKRELREERDKEREDDLREEWLSPFLELEKQFDKICPDLGKPCLTSKCAAYDRLSFTPKHTLGLTGYCRNYTHSLFFLDVNDEAKEEPS